MELGAVDPNPVHDDSKATRQSDESFLLAASFGNIHCPRFQPGKDVSVNRLVKDLKERSLTSKVRHLSSGGTRGGIPFTQGPLFYMLRNRFYVGEVKFKGEILPGPQPPLIEHDLFRPS